MPYAANHFEVMGVRVSPNEAQLLEWLPKPRRPGDVRFDVLYPAGVAAAMGERLRRAKLLMRDIERVADWKARHGC